MTSLPGARPIFIKAAADLRNADTRGFDRVHRQKHADIEDEFLALVTMMGLGSAGPTANTVYRGTGAGTAAFGPVVSEDLALGAVVQVGVNAPSGTVAATGVYTTPTNGSVTLTCKANSKVLVAFNGAPYCNAGGAANVSLTVSGATSGTSNNAWSQIATTSSGIFVARIFTVNAGANTFSVQFQVSGATLNISEGFVATALLVVELRRPS